MSNDEIAKRCAFRIALSAAISGAGAAMAVAAEGRYLRSLGAAVAVFNGIYAILWIVMGVEATKEAAREKPVEGEGG